MDGLASTLLTAMLAFAVDAGKAGADSAALAPTIEDEAGTRPVPPPVPLPVATAETPDTVLEGRVDHGGYGAPVLKVTSLAGDGVALAGVEGGWIAGHRLVVGGAAYGTISNVVSPQSLQPSAGDARLGIAYGGLRVGGILQPRRVSHVTFGLLVGGGRADSESPTTSYHVSDRYFVLEPDLGGEVNVSRNVRVGLGGTYRFVLGTEVSGLTATRLSGPAAMATLRIGQF